MSRAFIGNSLSPFPSDGIAKTPRSHLVRSKLPKQPRMRRYSELLPTNFLNLNEARCSGPHLSTFMSTTESQKSKQKECFKNELMKVLDNFQEEFPQSLDFSSEEENPKSYWPLLAQTLLNPFCRSHPTLRAIMEKRQHMQMHLRTPIAVKRRNSIFSRISRMSSESFWSQGHSSSSPTFKHFHSLRQKFQEIQETHQDACDYVSNIYKRLVRKAPSVLDEDSKSPFRKQVFSSQSVVRPYMSQIEGEMPQRRKSAPYLGGDRRFSFTQSHPRLTLGVADSNQKIELLPPSDVTHSISSFKKLQESYWMSGSKTQREETPSFSEQIPSADMPEEEQCLQIGTMNLNSGKLMKQNCPLLRKQASSPLISKNALSCREKKQLPFRPQPPSFPKGTQIPLRKHFLISTYGGDIKKREPQRGRSQTPDNLLRCKVQNFSSTYSKQRRPSTSQKVEKLKLIPLTSSKQVSPSKRVVLANKQYNTLKLRVKSLLDYSKAEKPGRHFERKGIYIKRRE